MCNVRNKKDQFKYFKKYRRFWKDVAKKDTNFRNGRRVMYKRSYVSQWEKGEDFRNLRINKFIRVRKRVFTFFKDFLTRGRFFIKPVKHWFYSKGSYIFSYFNFKTREQITKGICSFLDQKSSIFLIFPNLKKYIFPSKKNYNVDEEFFFLQFFMSKNVDKYYFQNASERFKYDTIQHFYERFFQQDHSHFFRYQRLFSHKRAFYDIRSNRKHRDCVRGVERMSRIKFLYEPLTRYRRRFLRTAYRTTLARTKRFAINQPDFFKNKFFFKWIRPLWWAKRRGKRKGYHRRKWVRFYQYPIDRYSYKAPYSKGYVEEKYDMEYLMKKGIKNWYTKLLKRGIYVNFKYRKVTEDTTRNPFFFEKKGKKFYYNIKRYSERFETFNEMYKNIRSYSFKKEMGHTGRTINAFVNDEASDIKAVRKEFRYSMKFRHFWPKGDTNHEFPISYGLTLMIFYFLPCAFVASGNFNFRKKYKMPAYNFIPIFGRKRKKQFLQVNYKKMLHTEYRRKLRERSLKKTEQLLAFGFSQKLKIIFYIISFIVFLLLIYFFF